MKQKNSRLRKAISPLIATVLLISFTFTIAAILAGWGQNIVTQSTSKSDIIQRQFAACSGGVIQFVDTGLQNPVLDGNQLKAQIKVDGVPLGNFTFVVFLSDLGTKYISDSTGTSLAPGPRNIGTVVSQPTDISRDNITSVMITSNCSDAKTVSRTIG